VRGRHIGRKSIEGKMEKKNAIRSNILSKYYGTEYVQYPGERPEGKKGEVECTVTGAGHLALRTSAYCCRQVLNSLQRERNV
jgi:hypothetical protein